MNGLACDHHFSLPGSCGIIPPVPHGTPVAVNIFDLTTPGGPSMEVGKIYEYALQREREGRDFFRSNAGRFSHAAVSDVF